jgi:hypothetical protein
MASVHSSLIVLQAKPDARHLAATIVVPMPDSISWECHSVQASLYMCQAAWAHQDTIQRHQQSKHKHKHVARLHSSSPLSSEAHIMTSNDTLFASVLFKPVTNVLEVLTRL